MDQCVMPAKAGLQRLFGLAGPARPVRRQFEYSGEGRGQRMAASPVIRFASIESEAPPFRIELKESALYTGSHELRLGSKEGSEQLQETWD